MKNRIISAGLMLALCLPLAIYGGLPFKIGMGLLGLLAYREIIDIKGYKKYPKGIVVLGIFAMILLIFSTNDVMFINFKYIAIAYLAFFLPVIFYFNKNNYTYEDAFKLSSFTIFIGITLNIAMNLRLYDSLIFCMLILITVLTDMFAYFTGMSIGKHKVTKISPKKSLEGYIGGVIMGTIITAIFYKTFIDSASLVKVVPVLIFLSVICELGDLFYSAVKRKAGIKDFSNLIPGHGGVLDRIDSLTFVIMAYIIIYGII